MFIKITVQKNKVTLKLFEKKTILDELEFQENRLLSQKLLEKIDFLLKRNGIKKNKIKKIDYSGEIPDTYTSGRIAESFQKSFNFGLKKQ
jgi:tRNA A37 threonylcarbamoyladenosine modification protein TsaB